MSGDVAINAVYINSLKYNAKSVRPSLVSQWPSKVVTGGDVTQDSHPYLSTLARLHDRTGGFGLFKQGSSDPTNMAWDATCETRYRNQLGRRPKQNSVTLSSFNYTITDTFTRVGNLGDSFADTGDTWLTAIGTTWTTDGTVALPPNANAVSAAYIETGAADGTITASGITNDANGNGVGIVFRYVDANNYWYLWTDVDGIGNYFVFAAKVIAGAPTTIYDSGAVAGAARATLAVVLSGSTVTLKADGTTVATDTGGTHSTATKHGVYTVGNVGASTQSISTWTYATSGTGNTITAVGGISHPYSTNLRGYFWSTKYVVVDDTSTGTGTLTHTRTLASAALSAVEFIPTAAGSVTTDTNLNMLYVAQGRYIDRTNIGATWVREDLTSSDSAQFLAVWDGRLWRVNTKGALFSSTAGHGTGGGGWTANATAGGLGIDGTYRTVTGLFVAKDGEGATVLWMTTNDGLYQHDATNTKWVGPILTWPRTTNGGRGSVEWKDKIYIPVGLDMYQVTPGTTTTIISMGPSSFDGMPAKCDGTITALVPTHNFLAAVITHTSAATSLEPRLIAWTGSGWHTIGLTTLSVQSGTTPSNVFVIDAWSQLRLYYCFQSDTTLYYQRLYTGVGNPRFNPTQSFDTSTQYAYFPWQSGSKEALKKLALRMVLRTSGCDATDYIRISYGVDISSDSTWTTLSTITSNGRQEITFDVDADTYNEGKPFDFLRFRFEVIGSTASANPMVEYWEVDYLQSLPPSWVYSMELDLTNSVANRSPQQQYDELRALANPLSQTTLVKLSWDSAAASPNIYMVRLYRLQALDQQTGGDPRGRYDVTFLEPVV